MIDPVISESLDALQFRREQQDAKPSPSRIGTTRSRSYSASRGDPSQAAHRLRLETDRGKYERGHSVANRISNRTAARLLGITPGTLRKWRHFGKGPAGYVAYSRSYGTYPEAAVIEWLAEKAKRLPTPLDKAVAPASGDLSV